MKRWIAILLAGCLVLALAGCHKEKAKDTAPTQPPTAPPTEPVLPKAQVEIFLPEQTSRWEVCGKELQERLEQQGHNSRVHYADGSAQEQAKQMQNLLQEGADLFLVASVDAHTLRQELDSAANAGVKVVTLDRQVLHTQGIDAAVTFDYLSLGVSMGYQIAEAKQLATARQEKRSHTIEFLMGSADDQNAVLIYQGLTAVLQPYLDSGVLVSKTGRVLLEDTYVQQWSAQEAQNKIAQYLEVYKEDSLDIVCTASDELAAGCIAALEAAGCTPENWPVITGIGGDRDAIRNILDGKQACTVYRDMSMFYDHCTKIAHNLLTGQPLPEQDGEVNGEIPTYICPGVQVDGVMGIGKLLDYGVTEQQLSLSTEDLEKITAPEQTDPVQTEPIETTAPPETTESTQPEKK